VTLNDEALASAASSTEKIITAHCSRRLERDTVTHTDNMTSRFVKFHAPHWTDNNITITTVPYYTLPEG